MALTTYSASAGMANLLSDWRQIYIKTIYQYNMELVVFFGSIPTWMASYVTHWCTFCIFVQLLAHSGSEIVTAVIMKSVVSWVVMPCSSEWTRRFGGTCSLSSHEWSVSQARSQQNRAAEWRLRLYVPPKRLSVSELHSLTSRRLYRLLLIISFQRQFSEFDFIHFKIIDDTTLCLRYPRLWSLETCLLGWDFTFRWNSHLNLQV
jgi:hypothetical protein